MILIGIMTGNSLDAVDVVLTRFSDKTIEDLANYSLPYPEDLRADFLTLKAYLSTDMDMDTFVQTPLFLKTHDTYIHLVAKAVNELIEKSGIQKSDISAVGFHGQTVDFCSASVAKNTHIKPYNTQMGSGQMLANLTGLPVIYDFRSDDVMCGGEGAPLAPTHNLNLAHTFDIDSAVFYNAGNTSNLAIVSNSQVIGWDAGPFNELCDKMVQLHKQESCDFDGKYGKNGTVDMDLLRRLFLGSAITADGENYLTLPPPKASDPKWYRFLDELKDPQDFENKLRTVEYFAAYTAVYTLKFIPKEIIMPTNFILFGGGWNNPICLTAFEDLLTGRAPVLPEHELEFGQILGRLTTAPRIWISHMGKYMEARIFADLARYYLNNRAWFENTPHHQPVRLGRIRYPFEGSIDDKVSRSAKGWQDKQSA